MEDFIENNAYLLAIEGNVFDTVTKYGENLDHSVTALLGVGTMGTRNLSLKLIFLNHNINIYIYNIKNKYVHRKILIS